MTLELLIPVQLLETVILLLEWILNFMSSMAIAIIYKEQDWSLWATCINDGLQFLQVFDFDCLCVLMLKLYIDDKISEPIFSPI